MLKFIWGRGQGPTAERLKLQKELFNFSRNITYGFPHKPSCLGWDPELRLLAVGTKTGQVRVFGRPGVEIIGNLDREEVGLVAVTWIPGGAACEQLMLTESDASTVYLYRCHNPTTLQKSAFKPKRGYESTTGIHLIDE